MDTINGGNQEKQSKADLPRRESAVWKAMKKVKTKLSLTDEGATPVNWKIVWLVFLSLFSSSFSLTFLFPFLPEMILGFGYREEDKGFYAGLVASAMFAGRAFGCFFWGWLSDVKGRKPVMLVTIMLNGVFSLLFGFTQNIYMAIITRFLTGLANGTVGTCKTILYEISDNTNQAVGMSIISVAWGGGIIVGPAIGGYLASPTKRYPDVFPPVGFLHQYPYFFPGFIAFLICVVATIVDIFLLPETLVKLKDVAVSIARDEDEQELEELTAEGKMNGGKKLSKSLDHLHLRQGPAAAMSVEDLHWEADTAMYLAQTHKEIHLTRRGFSITDDNTQTVAADDSGEMRRRHGKHRSMEHVDRNHHDDHQTAKFFMEEEEEGQGQMKVDIQADGEEHKGDNSANMNSALSQQKMEESSSLLEDDKGIVVIRDQCNDAASLEKTSNADSSNRKSLCSRIKNLTVVKLMFTFDVFIACTVYSVYSFALIGYDELFTVWAATETRLDGLGFEPNQIGTVLGTSSIPLLCLQLFIFPMAARKFDIRKLYLFFTAISMVLMAALPMLHLLIDRPVLLWTLLIGLSTPMRLMASCTFSCTGLFINNSVYPSQAGSVNGLSMTLTAITRTFAPIMGGGIFAWTVGYSSENLGPPFDVSFSFFVFSVFVFCVCLLGVFVPDHLSKQKK